MKVGLLCENYFPTLGGIQEHVLNLRRYLEAPPGGEEPVEVRIITGRVDGVEWHGAPDDARVLRPARSFRYKANGSVSQVTLAPSTLFALRETFERERFDLLHVHAPCDVGLPAYALVAFDGPIVGTLHSYFPHAMKRHLAVPWYRHVMHRCARVIAVSEAARDTMLRYAEFDATIIGNGVDCDAFERGRPVSRFSDGMRNILSVGRLEHRNGIDLVIDAFAILARERPDVRLLLAGDGPGRVPYESRARALPEDISRRIVFLGAIWDERADLFASAHCFALGARWVSFSILLLEALAAGLHVAALPCGGMERAGEHWSLANVSEEETPDSYAVALRQALGASDATYPARAREMAHRFDWRRIVPRIREVYADALSRRQP